MREVSTSIYRYHELSSYAQAFARDQYDDDLDEEQTERMSYFLDEQLLCDWYQGQEKKSFLKVTQVENWCGSIRIEYEIDWGMLRDELREREEDYLLIEVSYYIESGDEIPDYLQNARADINGIVYDEKYQIEGDMQELFDDFEAGLDSESLFEGMNAEFYKNGTIYKDDD